MDNKKYLNKLIKIATYKRLLNFTNEETIKKDFNKHIENLGYIFGIDDSHIYKIKTFNKELIKQFKNIEADPEIEKCIKQNKLKMLFSNKATIKYIYDLIESNNDSINKIALFFPNEFLEALYLYTIINN